MMITYTATHTVVDDCKFPLAANQPTHFNPSITNLAWAVALKTPNYATPETKEKLWRSKGYNLVLDKATEKALWKGTTPREELHSTIWQILFNQPRTLVIYTTKVDDYALGIIKFALKHGTVIKLEDTYSGIKTIYKPVVNLFKEQLFYLHKVEEKFAQLSKLKPDVQAKVIAKHTQLVTHRQQFEDTYVWPRINEQLAPLTTWYAREESETVYERAVLAQRYNTLDAIQAYQLPRSLTDFDDPKLILGLVMELDVWAKAFDIDIKLTQSDPNFYLPKGNQRLTPYTVKRSQMQKLLAQHAPIHELINAYMQVKFYQEHGAEYFLSPNYYLCEACGRPVNTGAEACPYCDTPNPHVHEEIPSEYMEYMAD